MSIGLPKPTAKLRRHTRDGAVYGLGELDAHHPAPRLDRPEAGVLEIRWFDTTAELSSDAFNQWLASFATLVESTRRPGLLVDSIAFRMDMSKMGGAWRDANIIPRYNGAGVKKFAFLMPQGMPAIGSASIESPGVYPTAYLGKREDALTWLKA